MATASLWVPVAKLAQLQDLVKAHNLRFQGNPFVMRARARVTLSAEHLPPGGWNAFWDDWYRLNTPIVESVRRPSLITRLRRLFRAK